MCIQAAMGLARLQFFAGLSEALLKNQNFLMENPGMCFSYTSIFNSDGGSTVAKLSS